MSLGDPIWTDDPKMVNLVGEKPLDFTSETFRVSLAQFTEKARNLAVEIKKLNVEDLEKWRAWLGSGDAGEYTNVLHQVTVMAR